MKRSTSSGKGNKVHAEIKILVLEAILRWIDRTGYKLPAPSSDQVGEIHVACELVQGSMVVDTLIFDVRTRRLKAIEFDSILNILDLPYKRIDFD